MKIDKHDDITSKDFIQSLVQWVKEEPQINLDKKSRVSLNREHYKRDRA